MSEECSVMETKRRHCSPDVAEGSLQRKKMKITADDTKNTKNMKNSPLPLRIMHSVRDDKVIKKEGCGITVDVLCHACKGKALLEEIRAKILREAALYAEGTGDNFEMMSYVELDYYKKSHYDIIMDYYLS